MAIDVIEVHLGGRFADAVRRDRHHRLHLLPIPSGHRARPLLCCVSLAGATDLTDDPLPAVAAIRKRAGPGEVSSASRRCGP